MLEKLFADNPKDIAVMESWGISLLGYARTLADLDLRKKARARAYAILIKAQSLGDNSDLLQTHSSIAAQRRVFRRLSPKRKT